MYTCSAPPPSSALRNSHEILRPSNAQPLPAPLNRADSSSTLKPLPPVSVSCQVSWGEAESRLETHPELLLASVSPVMQLEASSVSQNGASSGPWRGCWRWGEETAAKCDTESPRGPGRACWCVPGVLTGHSLPSPTGAGLPLLPVGRSPRGATAPGPRHGADFKTQDVSGLLG